MLAVIRQASLIGLGLTASTFATPLDDTRESTCFGGQIEHPQAAKIGRNTIFIAEMRADGTLISAATGFVVHGGSAANENGHRIVTAAHVLDPGDSRPGDVLMVFLSDGMPLGVPRVLAMTSERKTSIADVDLVVNDLAVLEIARFSDADARDRFAALDGLSVRAGGALMIGETSGTAGVIWGYSGAPAVDGDGQVVGVVTGADFRGRTTLRLGAIQGVDAEGRPQSREVTLPNRSLVIVEPLHTLEILRELDFPMLSVNDREETPVVLTGFPFANCASTSASLQTASSPGAAKLLKKWQLSDQAGAGWLPLELSVKKLRLSPE